MARYGDLESHYLETDFNLPRQGLDLEGIFQVLSPQVDQPTDDEVTYAQLTADVNNFSLADRIIHRFTTDASRTITGFASVGLGIRVVLNSGVNDLVLANNSGSSSAENRILASSGANITLTPNQIALIFYDRTATRVRAGKLS